jgi:hypothetical protein
VGVGTRSYFAPRGDLELAGLNRELERLPLSTDAFVDFRCTVQNDGVQLTLFYRPEEWLRLQAAAPDDGGWFLKNGFADHVDLVFSAPVDKGSVELGSFLWQWDGGQEEVDPDDIEYSELDRQLRILAPTLPADYVGPLTLTFADIDSAETEPISDPISLHYDVTEEGSAKAQQGLPTYSKDPISGFLAVSRMVVPAGSPLAEMVATFIRHHGLEKERVLKVNQVVGPNNTVEVFLLWWKGTFPRLLSLTPRPSGTLVGESPPTSITLQFDQPIVNPAPYLWVDDVQGTHVSFTVAQLDETGKQWQISKSGGIFSGEGQHTLRIAGLPDVTGTLVGPPYVYSWQTQNLINGEVIIAGDGLERTGDQIDVNVDDETIEIAADELRVKDSGITEVKLGLSDNLVADVSTSKHGLCPKAPNSANQVLLGTGVFGTLPGRLIAVTYFTTAGSFTWTPDARTTSYLVFAKGGGAGSAASGVIAIASVAIVSGGASGSWCQKYYNAPPAGAVNGSVGGGGGAGAPGGTTSFPDTAASLTAPGGGIGTSSGSIGAAVIVPGGVGGGVPTGGDLNSDGDAGGDAIATGIGAGQYIGGRGASGPLGAETPGVVNATPGATQGYGSGAAGGSSATAGAGFAGTPGTDGVVIVYEFA